MFICGHYLIHPVRVVCTSTACTNLFFGRNFARYVEVLDSLQANAEVVRHSTGKIFLHIGEVDVWNAFLLAELSEGKKLKRGNVGPRSKRKIESEIAFFYRLDF